MSAAASSSALIVISEISNAIKACGSLVRVDAQNFQRIIDANPSGLYVTSTGGLLNTYHKYLTSYRGLTFHYKTKTPLRLPSTAEHIVAKKLSIPDL